MPIPSDTLIVDPAVVGNLSSAEQASNYVSAKIEELRTLIRNEPPPKTAQVNCFEYIRWERRVLITHGQAVGALQALQAFGHISVPQFKVLKDKIIGVMLRKTADVQMGQEKPRL
jgi:hypothetical protein